MNISAASASSGRSFSTVSPPVAAGTGHLEVVLGPRGSVVRRAHVASPLRLLTPRNHGHAAWVYAGSYGGGLVGGDALRLSVRIGDGASAFVSTQAATKVYRSDRSTSVETDAVVAPDGTLILWPDPVVCFAGSTYQQTQDIEVARDGALVLVDWMTSGRRASGERWRFTRYANRSTVRYDGRLVLLDSMSLEGGGDALAERMGRFDVLCSATIVGPGLRGSFDRILATVSALRVARAAPMLVAAAPLADVGGIVRMAGSSVEQIGRALREHLSFVACLLGDDPWARKW